MFANRDYVYQRRWLYDKNTGMIIIVSKGMDHPNAPNRPDTYRYLQNIIKYLFSIKEVSEFWVIFQGTKVLVFHGDKAS